jgi:hypothetical protein
MQRLDRMAVVVMPREPLLDWVNTVSPEEPVWVDELADRANVYFIPRYETLDDAEAHMRGSFDEIFCNELAEWFDDESRWPEKRTYEMFTEWFDVFYDVVVFDTLPRPPMGHHN